MRNDEKFLRELRNRDYEIRNSRELKRCYELIIGSQTSITEYDIITIKQNVRDFKKNDSLTISKKCFYCEDLFVKHEVLNVTAEHIQIDYDLMEIYDSVFVVKSGEVTHIWYVEVRA